MLTIRDGQMHALALERSEQFVAYVADQACHHWPRFAENSCRHDVLEWVRARVRRAFTLGWSARGEVLRYLNVAIALGAEFETDPRYPWINALMRSPVEKREKLRRLCALAKSELDEGGGRPVVLTAEAADG